MAGGFEPWSGTAPQSVTAAGDNIAKILLMREQASNEDKNARALADAAYQSGAITADAYTSFITGSQGQKRKLTGQFVMDLIGSQRQQQQMQALNEERQAQAQLRRQQAEAYNFSPTPEQSQAAESAGYKYVFVPGKGTIPMPYQGGGNPTIDYTDASGQKRTISANSVFGQQIARQRDPGISLMEQYGLKPIDMFDSSIHRAGTIDPTTKQFVDTPGKTDDQGNFVPTNPNAITHIQVGDAQPMTKQLFRYYQNKLVNAGFKFSPPPPANAQIQRAIPVNQGTGQPAQVQGSQSQTAPTAQPNLAPPDAATLQKAQAAIANGANPDAVKQRLQQAGYDASQL